MQEWQKREREIEREARGERPPWWVRWRWAWVVLTIWLFMGGPVGFFMARHQAGLPDSPGGARILPSETAAMYYALLICVLLIPAAIMSVVAFMKHK